MVTFLAGRTPTLNIGEGGGGGRPQEHGISQIVEQIVRIIEVVHVTFPTTFDHD